MRKKKKKLG